MVKLFSRMIGAARLDAATYEEVEADPGSITGSVLVVLAASVAAAVGSHVVDVAGLVGMSLVSLATWAIWVGLTYFIGTQLLPGPETHSSIPEVLRTTGFSASPGLLRIFGLIPGVGLAIFLVVTLWMLLTFVIAIRQALDYTTSSRAFAVCFLGWLIYGILFFGFVLAAL